jgi:hypothetical protein
VNKDEENGKDYAKQRGKGEVKRRKKLEKYLDLYKGK